jgi:hypothetical protein
MITGVLGPHSNAHGPNEFLHIPMGKRVTACVAGWSPTTMPPASVARPRTWPSVAGGSQHGEHGCCERMLPGACCSATWPGLNSC